MAYERPAWAAGSEVPQNMPPQKNVLIDVGEFIRTRDALTAAYLGLSASLDRAVKAYLDHTQVVLAGDASLNVSHLIQPFNVLTNHAQMAQMALGQSNGVIAPALIANGGVPVGSEEPTDGKKKRKKRNYKARDPNAPKRPLTAYFRFLGENRAAIAAEIQANPELFAASGKPGDISRVATDRWNALNPDQREPYRAAYQLALKEYEKEVEKYKASGGKAEDLDETKVDESLIEPGALAGAEQSDEDSEDEEEVIAPPPPPVKSPKKTSKKAKQPQAPPTTVAPSQIFSSIDPDNLVADPPPAPTAPMSSASKKRGAAADGEGASKKRSRKSAAAPEAVVAAADPVPVAGAVPVAPLAGAVAPSSPEETGGKKKKSKKKSKGGDA